MKRRDWIAAMASWFAPVPKCCTMCGGRTFSAYSRHIPVSHRSPAHVLAGVCDNCLRQIPWIAQPQCRICGRPIACEDCKRKTGRNYVFCRSAVYYDEQMKDWLAQYKYRGKESLAPVLAAMLAFAYENILREWRKREVQDTELVITSVPLAKRRLHERGFNQAENIARQLADWYGLRYMPLLRRTRDTAKQSLKERRDRLLDMRGSFEWLPSTARGRVLIVDDIYTTGSTLDECARMLLQAHEEVEVYGLLWARS